MSRLFWTDDKINILIAYLRNSISTKAIAQKMNTTIDAVGAAIGRYNLQKHILSRKTTETFKQNINFDDLKDKSFETLKKESKLQWKIPQSKKQLKKKSQFKTGLLFPDAHIPHHNPVVCKAILKLMDDITFDKMVIMGDFCDLGCVSHWNKNRHKTLEMKRLKSDYIIANTLLDEFDKRLPKNCEKHFLYGNHEKWADDLLEEMPALEGMIEPKEMLFLKRRNYKIYDYNTLVKFGRLYVTHGMYASVNPIKKHIDDLKVNILFAHTHSLGMRLSTSPARSIAFSGYNIGCVCDLAPAYMKKRANAWTHGFAIGYFYPNGYFDVVLIRIINGQFIFNGKLYDGNK